MQASSEGRNIEKIMPTGRAGLPKPSSAQVSVGAAEVRSNEYGPNPACVAVRERFSQSTRPLPSTAHRRASNPRLLPIPMRQTDRITQRIHLPLALTHPRVVFSLSFVAQLNGGSLSWRKNAFA